VGTSIGLVTGNIDAALNFFAKNNQLNVLSTPRLTARSGGTAQIQVGSDVPIITSQRATDTQSTDNGTDILQSVDYRSTGVLLSIEPIVFGDNRVDLAITQEVSTAIPTTSSQISSPTISNRSVTTQLSLEDGATAILGGLIQETTTRDETGTPILKDIPLIGNLFRNTTLSNTRTELIVLITAYVVRDGEEKKAFTDELVGRFNLTTTDPGNMDTYLGVDLRQ
jgi:general secretion pathway protein D